MRWKKIGLILLLAFLLFFLVRSPVESATTIKEVAGALGRAANSLATALTTFLQTLF